MENILITNKERFEELKKEFKKDGVEKLHVLADFDRTFTYAFVNGKKIPSLLSILRDEKYLTPDYSEKANALFDISPTSPDVQHRGRIGQAKQ